MNKQTKSLKSILNTYTVKNLKNEIAKTNIKGYSKMTKSEIIEIMMKYEYKFHHLKSNEKIKNSPNKYNLFVKEFSKSYNGKNLMKDASIAYKKNIEKYIGEGVYIESDSEEEEEEFLPPPPSIFFEDDYIKQLKEKKEEFLPIKIIPIQPPVIIESDSDDEIEVIPTIKLPSNTMIDNKSAFQLVNWVLDKEERQGYINEINKKVSGKKSSISTKGIPLLKKIKKLRELILNKRDKIKNYKNYFVTLGAYSEDIKNNLFYDYKETIIDPSLSVRYENEGEHYLANRILKKASKYVKDLKDHLKL